MNSTPLNSHTSIINTSRKARNPEHHEYQENQAVEDRESSAKPQRRLGSTPLALRLRSTVYRGISLCEPRKRMKHHTAGIKGGSILLFVEVRENRNVHAR